MPWTDDEKLSYLLLMPWTLVREQSSAGGASLYAREIPEAVGRGATDGELAAGFWLALRNWLRARLEAGEALPLPTGVHAFPWNEVAPEPLGWSRSDTTVRTGMPVESIDVSCVRFTA